MADYDNRNTGILFKNDRKESDKHPDYTGSWTDKDNVEFFLSGWKKEGKNGPFISLRLGNQKTGSKPASAPAKKKDSWDDF